jgi:hypothetical protein
VEGILDTSDLGSTTLLDPANDLVANLPGQNPYTQVRIDRIDFDVEDTLEVRLAWDATSPVRIGEFTGRGNIDYTPYSGIKNNSGAGKTGKILYSTEGWTAGKILSFTVFLKGIRQ